MDYRYLPYEICAKIHEDDNARFKELHEIYLLNPTEANHKAEYEARAIAGSSANGIKDKRDVYLVHKAILDGLHIEIPDVFPDGQNIHICRKCHRRCTTTEMIKVTKTGIVWMDTCQACVFKANHKKLIGSTCHTSRLDPLKDVSEKQCPLCGEILPIDDFPVKCYSGNHHNGKRYHRYCKECMDRIGRMNLPRKRGVTMQTPLIYNIDGSEHPLLNYRFFVTDEEYLNDTDRCRSIKAAVGILNTDSSYLKYLRDTLLLKEFEKTWVDDIKDILKEIMQDES